MVEETSQFNDNFIKNNKADSDKEYFLEGDVQCPEKLHNLHNYLPFLPEKKKLKKLKNLPKTCMIKKKNLYNKFKTSIKPWLSIEINYRTLAKKRKKDFEKIFF